MHCRRHMSSLSQTLCTRALPLLLVAALASAQIATAQSTPEPRIPPLDSSEAPIQLLKVMANHPDLMTAWGGFGGYILSQSTLPARDRELVILRTAYNNGTAYEWGHHARAARGLGVTDEEVAAVAKGANAEIWSSFERALIRAADELHRDSRISDRTWAYIDARYDEKQLMDLVFTIGQYRLVSMAINAFRVPLDEGLEPIPGSE